MSFQGSNRFQMRAMDLQGHGRQPAAPAGDNGALSARTLLIRRKLMERKRFDSADYAMDKNKRQKDETGADAAAEGLAARAGAAALLSALQDQREQVQVQEQAQEQEQEQEQRAARYGGLARGGAGAARSILLQKKLREKKHFDSADYQLARQGGEAAARALVVGVSPADSDNEDTDGSSPMDVDEDARINSPSAARVGIAAAISDGDHRIVQMSPSLRGGERPAAFDAASPTHPYAVVDADKQRFFVPAGEPTARSADAAQPQGGQSKYGRLCAANVLIRRKLKERKRFDSADYAMEKQSEQETNEPAVDEGGSSGAIRGGHVVMMSPTKHHRRQSTDATAYGMTRGDTSPSISHQVKHIKLSEEARGGNGMGWASAVATSSVAGVDLGRATSASQDSRLAARNIILQRKLAERKKFDSADYYKSRSTTSG